MDRLKRQIDYDGNRTKSMVWSERSKLLARNPGKKAMIVGIVLAILTHFSGNFVFMDYTASIFRSVGSLFAPNQSALIVASIQFVGTCTVPFLIDRAGRKVIHTAFVTLFTSKLIDFIFLGELVLVHCINSRIGIRIICAGNICYAEIMEFSC